MSDIACQQPFPGPQKIPGVGEITVHIPCADPQPNCPKPPTGPGTSHVGDIPGTNVQIHIDSGGAGAGAGAGGPSASAKTVPYPPKPEPPAPYPPKPEPAEPDWSWSGVLAGFGAFYLVIKVVELSILSSNPVTAPVAIPLFLSH